MSAETTILDLVHSGDAVDIPTLEALYDALPPIDMAFMSGEWRGGCFNSGHRGEALLRQLQWCGKHFRDQNDVDPMLCKQHDGSIAASDVLGTASLRMVEYRGVVTATMVYDTQPIFDHFKKLDDNTVLGAMDRKSEKAPLFFYLTRHA